MADPYRWGDVTPAGAARIKALRQARGIKSRIAPAWDHMSAARPAGPGLPAVSITSLDFGSRAVLCIGDRELQFSRAEVHAIEGLLRRHGRGF